MTSKFRPKWQNFAKYGHTAPQLKVRLKGCGLRGEVESQKKYKKMLQGQIFGFEI